MALNRTILALFAAQLGFAAGAQAQMQPQPQTQPGVEVEQPPQLGPQEKIPAQLEIQAESPAEPAPPPAESAPPQPAPQPTPPAKPAPQPKAKPQVHIKPAPDDPVVARVNGEAIHLSEVTEAQRLLPPRLQSAPLRGVYAALVDSLVNTRLAADKARDLGFHETPEHKKRLAQVEAQLLERLLLTRHIEGQLTEEVLTQRYARLAERIQAQHEVRARHILVKDEEVATTLAAKLDDGDDFEDLAKDYSLDATAKEGGDLGWFGPGRFPEAFDTAAMSLPAGEYTRVPVQTQAGWHLIKVEEWRPMPVPTLEQARPILVNELSAELGQNLMEMLRGDAKIETTAFEDLKLPQPETQP